MSNYHLQSIAVSDEHNLKVMEELYVLARAAFGQPSVEEEKFYRADAPWNF